MHYQNIILHLSLISGIGPSVIIKIVALIGLENIETIYQFSVTDFIKLGLSEKKAEELVSGLADKKLLENELKLIQDNKVTIVTLWCKRYSRLLSEIHIPPVILYCQGNIDLLSKEKMIACVGARKARIYARDTIKHILTPLLLDDWVVVSGGAAGADTYAHQTALELNAATIVVVGSGLCYQYPPENKPLFEKVLSQNGLIVSSFAMNVRPDTTTFPARNRIISGLSLGCLVVQAASKSGALITAQQALEQSREVFAVPGSIFEPLSDGCHDLIHDGAKITRSAQDILDEFQQFKLASDFHEKNNDIQLKIHSDKAKRFNSQDPLEQAILGLLITPRSADQLLTQMDVELDVLQSLLFSLTLEGLIFQDSMGFWSLK